MENHQTETFIDIHEFCINHHVDISFILSLQQSGLIEITTIKETAFIDASMLQQLEKIVRLYYELDINIEGIESIIYLLQRINLMHEEISILKNRLRIYESNE